MWFKGHNKTNLARFIFADSKCKESFVDLIFHGGRLRDFYECFITEIRNKTNEIGIFVEFTFAIDHQIMFCGFFFFFFFFCVLGKNPQKLIKHKLISKKIIPLR